MLGRFTPEAYAMASFSLLEALTIVLEAKGVLSKDEVVALYADKAAAFEAASPAPLNVEIAALLRVVAALEWREKSPDEPIE